MVVEMRNNLLFKILASIPVILLTLYFIPFLGVILILFSCIVIKKYQLQFLLL